MQNIFDLLLRNIGLIIVIGGLVLSLLAKRRASGRRNGSSPSGKRKPMMPPFGGDGQLTLPQTGRFGKRERSPIEQPTHVVTEQLTEQEERESFVPLKADRQDQPARMRNYENKASREERAEKRGRNPLVIDNDAMRGIMWAEIIGPPRSKKPFKPGNR